MDNTLPIWVIYFNPADFPGQYVARLWKLDQPTDQIITGKTLEELRETFSSQGLVCLTRDPSDPAVVVESWL